MNTTVNLVDDLYSVSQQSAEATYQHEMESYADGNRLFRICSVREESFRFHTFLFFLKFKNDRRVTTSLIIIDTSDDEDEAKQTESGTQYADTYLHGNENDLDETVTAHLRSRLRKKPRFLIRFEIYH